jgi:phage host-nuclease inhibitor protein Gam
MTRLKPNVKKIESLEDANLILKEIGLLERELETIDGDAHKQIAEIKAAAVKAGEACPQTHCRPFGPARRVCRIQPGRTVQRQENHTGFLWDFRLPQKHNHQCQKTTIGLLKKLHLEKYIRVKEEVNKEAIAALNDKSLRQVDAVRKVKDDFFCEANKEEINKDLLKEQMYGGFAWEGSYSGMGSGSRIGASGSSGIGLSGLGLGLGLASGTLF